MSKIKILHTSDWHLGKRLHKKERFEEHQFFLDWLYRYIVDESINILLIAGDIFDVPTPPNKSLKQFYQFIHRIGKLKNFRSIIICGNHDSKELLKAPALFFEDHNCHIFTDLTIEDSRLRVQGIEFTLLPYFRNFELTNEIISTQSKNEEEYFKNFFKPSTDHINILMSHHCFGEYAASGSEQAIYLSGVDYFPLNWVNHYDYVALGHIHKRQSLSQEPPIVYPGSPIPLRFSESNQKYCSLVEINDQKLKQSYIEIPQGRKLIQLATDQENIIKDLQNLITKERSNSYIEVSVELKSPQAGLANTIREKLSGSNLELLSFRPYILESKDENISLSKIQELDISSLFIEYYQHKFPEEKISDELIKSFNELIETSNETP